MSVTVLQLSDIHFMKAADGNISGYQPDARLAAVLDAWEALGETPDLVLLSGDNAEDGSADAYARLSIALQRLDAPILAIAGNHDDPAVLAEFFGGASVAELDGWRVVGLDSSVPRHVDGTIDPAATAEWLDALDDTPTIVAVHHPPRSRSTNKWFQLNGGAELLADLGQRENVRALVSGHLHDAFEFEGPGGLALLGCPSTLMAIGHEGDIYTIGVDAPTGARILRLHDDGTFDTTVLVA